MKPLIIIIILSIFLLSVKCLQDENSPAPMVKENKTHEITTREIQGDWIIRRHEQKNLLYTGFQDNSTKYVNHYNSKNSHIYFTIIPYTATLGGQKQYKCIKGLEDKEYPSASFYYISGNDIIYDNYSRFNVVYFENDSMILEDGDKRYFLSKNNETPLTDNLKLQQN